MNKVGGEGLKVAISNKAFAYCILLICCTYFFFRINEGCCMH